MSNLLKYKENLVRTMLSAIVTTFIMSPCDDNDKIYVCHSTNYISIGVVDEKGRIETDKGNT